MSTHVASTTIGPGSFTSRAGLALALALLAVPGVTIAWDLPAGGFYIGVPLAIAAAAVGIRTRRHLSGAKGTKMATIALVIAGLALLFVVVGTVAGG